MEATVHTNGAVPTERAPTQRTRWEAARDTLAHPAEWGLSQWVVLLSVFVLLAVLAFWGTRPGSVFGGAEPIQASLVYASNADGTYIYRLQEPPRGTAELAATLQSIYDAHRAAVADGSMSVLLLRRTADAAPFVVGQGDRNGPDVLGRLVRDGARREAALRATADKPLEPVHLRW